MAKTKTPFLSLGSQGTFGGFLTSQKRGSATLLREKPVPTDPYSLPQAYQRWLYEDYAYLWTLQSEATRRSYAATGSRYHLTGFQYWMKYQLTNLPDILGYWKLDLATGAVALDSSRNANHGTIFGASAVPGRIADALYFDGLNDWVNTSHPPMLVEDLNTFSVEAFVTSLNKMDALIGFSTTLFNFGCFLNYNDINPAIFLDAWNYRYFTTGNLWDGNTHHVAFLVAGNDRLDILDSAMYIDGQPSAVTVSQERDPPQTKTHFLIGRSRLYYTKGMIDHLIVRNRILDPTEILRHSLRRYSV